MFSSTAGRCWNTPGPTWFRRTSPQPNLSRRISSWRFYPSGTFILRRLEKLQTVCTLRMSKSKYSYRGHSCRLLSFISNFVHNNSHSSLHNITPRMATSPPSTNSLLVYTLNCVWICISGKLCILDCSVCFKSAMCTNFM